jgi:hypothetical protein
LGWFSARGRDVAATVSTIERDPAFSRGGRGWGQRWERQCRSDALSPHVRGWLAMLVMPVVWSVSLCSRTGMNRMRDRLRTVAARPSLTFGRECPLTSKSRSSLPFPATVAADRVVNAPTRSFGVRGGRLGGARDPQAAAGRRDRPARSVA